MRYKLELQYLGTNYHGWQRQPNADTVQQRVEEAFATVFGETVDIVGCGRTDTGVHARFFVAHFDAQNCYDKNTAHRLNRFLPHDIAILSVAPIADDFHARFSAKNRTYMYYINRYKNPFVLDRAWFVPSDLNLPEMNAAARQLLDYQDFTSFSKLHTDVKTNNCKILSAAMSYEAGMYVFRISADRFLRNMVRAIVGTLVDVGRGKISVDDFRNIIEAKNRSLAGNSAPAKGLFLVDVEY